MYDVCQKNDCCSIIYCLKNALGELLDSKKIKKKELVGEDISNNQVIESDIDSLKKFF